MHFVLLSLLTLLSFSGFVLTAATPPNTDQLYAFLEKQNREDQMGTLRNIPESTRKQLFVSRINAYRGKHNLTATQDDILNRAIEVVQAGKPTSELKKEGSKAFGFDNIKRLLNTLSNMDEDDSVPSGRNDDLTQPRDMGYGGCECSWSDDWCDDGFYCELYPDCDSPTTIEDYEECCTWDDVWYYGPRCGTGMFFHDCNGLCVANPPDE